MDRRSFIRLAGGGVVMAATASCAPTGPDPRAAWVNPGAGETDIRRKVLSWAILAPNPHNMQPWLVDLTTPDEIALYIDRTRLLPVTDPFNRQIVIGCGAFLELLVMALAQDGYAADITPFPDGEPAPRLDDRPLFRLRMRRPSDPAGAKPDTLFPYAQRRRTNREPFIERPLTPDDIKVLHGADRTDGAPLSLSLDPARIERLRALVYRGAEIEAHTPAAHHESVERTFIGSRDVAEHPWGISLDKPVMTAMNAVGVLTKEKMATPGTTAYAESLKFLKAGAYTARGFVWITTAADTRIDQLRAGRAYLLANLAATKRGIAMHPWSQGLQEYATQKPVFDALHRELAPDGGRIQMLARIGYPKAQVPAAPRRGLAAQIRKA